MKRVPSAYLEVVEPHVLVGRLAGLHEHAIGEARAGFPQVVVPVVFLPAFDHAIEIAAKLFVPAEAKEIRIRFDYLGVMDVGFEDADATDGDVLASETHLLERPGVADELRSEVPLLTPPGVEICGAGLVVGGDHEAIFQVAKEVEAAGV